MTITITNTTKVVQLNGIPARIWEGHTDSGIKVHCFITLIAISKEEQQEVHEYFEKELSEQRPPSEELNVYPLRMIL